MATKHVVIFNFKEFVLIQLFCAVSYSTGTVAMIDKTLIAFISCVVMRSLCL